MPFKLRKAPKKDLYWVVGPDGKHHSKDPLPKERAKAQMRALYAAEGGYEMKGGMRASRDIRTTVKESRATRPTPVSATPPPGFRTWSDYTKYQQAEEQRAKEAGVVAAERERIARQRKLIEDERARQERIRRVMEEANARLRAEREAEAVAAAAHRAEASQAFAEYPQMGSRYEDVGEDLYDITGQQARLPPRVRIQTTEPPLGKATEVYAAPPDAPPGTRGRIAALEREAAAIPVAERAVPRETTGALQLSEALPRRPRKSALPPNPIGPYPVGEEPRAEKLDSEYSVLKALTVGVKPSDLKEFVRRWRGLVKKSRMLHESAPYLKPTSPLGIEIQSGERSRVAMAFSEILTSILPQVRGEIDVMGFVPEAEFEGDPHGSGKHSDLARAVMNKESAFEHQARLSSLVPEKRATIAASSGPQRAAAKEDFKSLMEAIGFLEKVQKHHSKKASKMFKGYGATGGVRSRADSTESTESASGAQEDTDPDLRRLNELMARRVELNDLIREDEFDLEDLTDSIPRGDEGQIRRLTRRLMGSREELARIDAEVNRVNTRVRERRTREVAREREREQQRLLACALQTRRPYACAHEYMFGDTKYGRGKYGLTKSQHAHLKTELTKAGRAMDVHELLQHLNATARKAQQRVDTADQILDYVRAKASAPDNEHWSITDDKFVRYTGGDLNSVGQTIADTAQNVILPGINKIVPGLGTTLQTVGDAITGLFTPADPYAEQRERDAARDAEVAAQDAFFAQHPTGAYTTPSGQVLRRPSQQMLAGFGRFRRFHTEEYIH